MKNFRNPVHNVT